MLVLSLFINETSSKIAATTIDNAFKYEILEIIANGDSQIKNDLDNSKYNVTTIRMKKFVALREEMVGKYDLILIASGDYNPAPINSSPSHTLQQRTNAHNTTNFLNDITNLKAKEIINGFINKGQPVIFHSDILKYNSSKLYKNFSAYTNTNNVKFYNDTITLKNLINNFYSNQFSKRPRIKLDEVVRPVEYVQNKQHFYEAGDPIRFDFSIANTNNSSNITANLYIDSNFDGKYTLDEIVLTKGITSDKGSIVYVLPRGYSGLRNWKLEIIDPIKSSSDYKSGSLFFKGETVKLRVLQVKKDTSLSSSLNNSSNNDVMRQSYLRKDNEYEIIIDVTDIDTFNKSRSLLNNDSKKLSHESINGTYDMLIFGFADVYNSAKLNSNAINSIEAFINTGQSIMFTHDTIYSSDNEWVKNFMDDTGQILPRTDLGTNAPNTTTNTIKVNEGLITQYPFLLEGQGLTIANTHNQYYTLNLEDESITPWYNVIGNTRDQDDSWNHYYTYSKGNITYSGTGHTNNKFPDSEQRLFVNTMYRAFLGSNHAPEIKVITPTSNATIPSHQVLEIAYSVEDLDLKDRKLKTRILFDDKEVFVDPSISNGDTVIKSFGNPLPNGGDLKITIEVLDKQGAISKQEVHINVKQISSNIEVSRQLNNPVSVIEVGKTSTIGYKIQPKPLQNNFVNGITGVRPIGVIDPIEGFTVNKKYTIINGSPGNSDQDSAFSGNFAGLSLSGANKKDFEEELRFGYELPLRIGDTILTSPGNIKRKTEEVIEDLTSEGPYKMIFPVIDDFPNGRKQVEITNFVEFEIEINSSGDIIGKFIRYINGNIDATLKVTNVQFRETFPAGLEVLLPEGNNFIKTGNLESGYTLVGTFDDIKYKCEQNGCSADPLEFTVTVSPKTKDQFTLNNSKLLFNDINTDRIESSFNSLTLVSDYAITDVQLPSEITVNKGIPNNLFPLLKIQPENASVRDIKWSENTNGEIITVDSNGIIHPVKKGTSIVTVTVTDRFGNVREAAIHVTVRVPIESIVVNDMSIEIGEIKSIPLNVVPQDSINNLIFEIANPNIAELNSSNGTIKGLNEGTTKLTVYGYGSSGQLIKDEAIITIVPVPVQSIEISPTVVNLSKFDEYNNFTVTINPNNATYKDFNWSTSNPNVVSIDSNGKIIAIGTGSSTITVTTHNGKSASAIVYVGSPLTDILVPTSPIIIEKGEERNLNQYISLVPSDATNVRSINFKSEDNYIATVIQTNIVNGKRLGESSIEVKVIDEDGNVFTKFLPIKVVEPGTRDTNDDRSKWLY